MLENIYNTTSLEWDNTTIYLYISVIFISYIFGKCAQNCKVLVICREEKIYRPKHHLNYFFFILIFTILFILSAFRDIGKDLPAYKEIFYYSNSTYVETFQNEPGFILINKILRLFTDNEFIAIFFFSFLSILFVYKTIEYYSDQIDISISLLAFTSIFYFQSFNLIRIYLVSYFLLLSFKYIINDKILKYALITLACTSVHYSSILMLAPILYYWLYKKNKKIFYISLILLILILSYIQRYLTILNIFERYEEYLYNANEDLGGIGFGQILYHLPLFLFIYYLKKTNVEKTTEWGLLYIYTIFSFIYGMLGYSIIMIGRVSIYFITIHVLLVPFFIRTIKNYNYKHYLAFKLLFILYYLFRCHMYFKEYLELDSIMPYKLTGEL